jgi:ubiquinone/menaquinone biosynthesis C-methylase UbiE
MYRRLPGELRADAEANDDARSRSNPASGVSLMVLSAARAATETIELARGEHPDVSFHEDTIIRPLNPLLERVQRYWNERIHDLEMTQNTPGTREFFADLDEYRFDKLRYLPRLVDFEGYRGRRLLEVGCGIGTDLVRFARGGAVVTGVDLSETALELARRNALHAGVEMDLKLANGEALPFDDASFDVVYGHGVLQYTAEPRLMVEECRRVLKPDGEAIFMVYNRVSWLNAVSKVMRVDLEHADAPVLRKYSIGEYRELLSGFASVRIVPERFPVKTRLHGGWKGVAYNRVFVAAFEALPRAWVRPFGWHLMAFCRKT